MLSNFLLSKFFFIPRVCIRMVDFLTDYPFMAVKVSARTFFASFQYPGKVMIDGGRLIEDCPAHELV